MLDNFLTEKEKTGVKINVHLKKGAEDTIDTIRLKGN